jgi:hypothetical protein
MKTLFFVVTREIPHPLTQETLLSAGDVISLDTLQEYTSLGIDNIGCELCVGISAREHALCRIGAPLSDF